MRLDSSNVSLIMWTGVLTICLGPLVGSMNLIKSNQRIGCTPFDLLLNMGDTPLKTPSSNILLGKVDKKRQLFLHWQRISVDVHCILSNFFTWCQINAFQVFHIVSD